MNVRNLASDAKFNPTGVNKHPILSVPYSSIFTSLPLENMQTIQINALKKNI